MTFLSHHDDDIHLWINTPQQVALLRHIRSMRTMEQIQEFCDEVLLEGNTNPEFSRTNTCKISCRAIQKQFHQLKKQGVLRVGPKTKIGAFEALATTAACWYGPQVAVNLLTGGVQKTNGIIHVG